MSISFSKLSFRILLLSVVIFACKPDKNKFSILPALELSSVDIHNSGFGKDSFVALKLHFTDGDGDIGLEPGDTMPPFGYGQDFFYNLHVWMYVRLNGIWIKPLNPFTSDTLNFHERLSNLTPTGKSKWIVGDLNLRIPAEPYALKPDSVKFVATLYDRKLHSSNTVETGMLILKH